MDLEVKKVTQAAIKDTKGRVHTLPRPARHHTIMEMMRDQGVDDGPHEMQGFVLDDGTFVEREEAGKIAIAAGQIEELNWPPDLFSEDL